MRKFAIIILGLLAFIAPLAHAQVSPNNVIYMTEAGFSPITLSVPLYSTVTWVNAGTSLNNAADSGHSFDTFEVVPGGRFSMTFTNPGTYTYYSRFTGASGVILVQPQVSNIPTQTTYSNYSMNYGVAYLYSNPVSVSSNAYYTSTPSYSMGYSNPSYSRSNYSNYSMPNYMMNNQNYSNYPSYPTYSSGYNSMMNNSYSSPYYPSYNSMPYSNYGNGYSMPYSNSSPYMHMMSHSFYPWSSSPYPYMAR